MSLTHGTGPFGRHAGGVFNFTREGPAHVLYWEGCPWRVRAEIGGETVADSRRVMLLHETGLLPVYYFPRDDVRFDRLKATETQTHCPFKGDASYWSVEAGGQSRTDAVWGYPSPLPHAPDIANYVAFSWKKVDRWFEEDQEAFVHARDPYHRLDVMKTSRRVQVSLHGTELADSTGAVVLFETGLPPRYYLPAADVRLDRLRPSDLSTHCPYKGKTTGYWSFEGPDGPIENIAWRYDNPLAEVGLIDGRICFYDEHVDVTLDGESQSRPETPFSH